MMLNCYNRGCGATFDPSTNNEDSCRHHPGTPFFHDVYKGWSCCNKKSVDFTEFLNIKGCTLSKHSNEKPQEPEKPVKNNEIEERPIEVRPPLQPSALKRPPFESPLQLIEPNVAPTLKQQIDSLQVDKSPSAAVLFGEIPVGTVCKNGGCKYSYESNKSDDTECIHHPGKPIFHEGMKYWSCCQRKTSDFSAFLEQVGCESGKHKWILDKDESKSVNCRYDWHQTGNTVVVAVYAKMYDYSKSYVKVNPIRLQVSLVFPQQENGEFNIDLELGGVIDVAKTKVQMLNTKVEITMIKAELGSWSKLNFPKQEIPVQTKTEEPKLVDGNDNDSDVDLDDIEAVSGVKITEA